MQPNFVAQSGVVCTRGGDPLRQVSGRLCDAAVARAGSGPFPPRPPYLHFHELIIIMIDIIAAVVIRNPFLRAVKPGQNGNRARRTTQTQMLNDLF